MIYLPYTIGEPFDDSHLPRDILEISAQILRYGTDY